MLRVVEDDCKSILMVTLKSVGRNFFKGRGAVRIQPVLTTKNEIIFEFCEVLERVCENPGEPRPPVADTHGHSRKDDEETEQGSS